MPPRLRAAASGFALALLAAPGASAEEAWARGAPLNLRAGAGIDQPVLGNVAPGERLEVVASSGEWARVRRADGSGGWIAASYLVRDAPPAARIADLEAETERLRQELEAAGARAEGLRQQRRRGSARRRRPHADRRAQRAARTRRCAPAPAGRSGSRAR